MNDSSPILHSYFIVPAYVIQMKQIYAFFMPCMADFLVMSQYIMQTMFLGLPCGWCIRISKDKYRKV
jgi:hypothetical protein